MSVDGTWWVEGHARDNTAEQRRLRYTSKIKMLHGLVT